MCKVWTSFRKYCLGLQHCNNQHMHTRCVYLIPWKPNYSAQRWADSFFDKICFIGLSIRESFCFSLFCRSFIWSAVDNLPFFFSLPPPILPHSDFMKLLATARKSLIGSWKLSRRSTMTRPWWERSYKRLSKGEIWEQAAAAADQRNFTATMSIADITAEVENERRESIMKLTQAHNVLVKTVHATLHKDLPLSGSWAADRSNCFTRRRRRSDSECARWSQRWPPQLFDHLGQRYQC